MENLNLPALEEFDPERVRVKLLHDSEALRLVLFCLQPGQAIPAHSATSTVVMHLVRGRGRFTVGETEHPATAGTVVVCPPNEAHGMAADEEMVVLATIAPRP
jgi:quercetin dioxygenase-like cupin family protein